MRDQLMRTSDFDTFASPDTEDVALDRYFSGDLTKAIEDFLTKHFGASVQVFSSFESRFYVSIQGKKTAEFLRRVMSLRREDEQMNILFSDTIDRTMHIILGTKNGFLMDEDDKSELLRLAKAAGFHILINEDNGMIVLKIGIEPGNCITVRASDLPCSMSEYLEDVFFGNK